MWQYEDGEFRQAQPALGCDLLITPEGEGYALYITRRRRPRMRIGRFHDVDEAKASAYDVIKTSRVLREIVDPPGD